MKAPRPAVFALAAVLTASAGCSGASAPVPAPTPTSTIEAPTSEAERELPFGGAPAVPEPMSLGKLAGDPCTEALTPQQVETAIGAQVAGEREDLLQIGPACAWTNRDTGGAVGVSYTLNAHEGLSAVYTRTRPLSPVWRVMPDVQGFPAVAHSDSKALNFCQESVGLRDDTSIDISLQLGARKRDKADACELIGTIADMVVTTLQTRPG